MKHLTIFLVLAGQAMAHHSAAPHYDLQKELSLSATVTKFEFVNPHGYVFFNTPDGAAWRCELAARTALERQGWTAQTFVPGQKVTIKGAPARREEHVCMLTSFIRADGTEIGRQSDVSRLGGAEKVATFASASQISTRPLKLADGKPNLQGYWVSASGPGGRGPGPDGKGKGDFKGPDFKGKDFKGKDFKGKDKDKGPPPNAPEMTAAGSAAAAKYDQRFDDPAVKCSPANIFFGWNHDQHVNEIVQTADSITLRYGYMDLVRKIDLKATTHPTNLKPSLGGHSIGHWEGDTLVVDTVGFEPGVLIPLGGILHSAQMHATERFSLDAATGALIRAYRAEDPTFWKGPYVGQDRMVLSAQPYSPYHCVELSGKNNLRPQ